MTDITELAQRMKAAAEKATQGEWWADEVKNEGCYGSGDDCVEGFTSYAIYGSDGQTLFDSLNSDAACISEEYDGEGHVAWDETAQRNAEFIALANPANIRALVEVLEKAQQRIDELENDEVRQRLANAECQLHMAGLRFHNIKASRNAQFKKRKAAERRIAELEESHAQVIQSRDHYKRMSEEGLKQLSKPRTTMSEVTEIDPRDAFEKVFPIPIFCIRCGDGYASTSFNGWDANTHIARWEGWKAASGVIKSRTVKLPADKVAESEVSGYDGTEFYRAGWNARGQADREALTTAGIKLEGE